VLPSQQYIEVSYPSLAATERITISTDNRNGPVHRYTGAPGTDAAGLVGEVDSTVVVPSLWQVYDEVQPDSPLFSDPVDTVKWAYVPDASAGDFATEGAINYRTVVHPNGLGDRPEPGRPATSPVMIYLTADFTGKPAQTYGTDRLIIEVIQQ
jgi:hypothetical protein